MNKILSLLGLAKMAGKLICGTDAVIDHLPKKEIKIIFLAKDASSNVIDKISAKAFYYNVKINQEFTSLELNHSLGSANLKVIGITDQGFTDAILKLM